MGVHNLPLATVCTVKTIAYALCRGKRESWWFTPWSLLLRPGAKASIGSMLMCRCQAPVRQMLTARNNPHLLSTSSLLGSPILLLMLMHVSWLSFRPGSLRGHGGALQIQHGAEVANSFALLTFCNNDIGGHWFMSPCS